MSVFGEPISLVHNSLFDADTFLYASVDNTPVATSPANVLAALSGHAATAFDFNSQALTGITTLSMNNQLTSTLADGTAPFVITSTTVNTNLNADLWDGYQFADYLDQNVKSGTSPTLDGTNFTGIPAAGVTNAVSATANLTDNALVRGHGGAKVVQTSSILIDDSNNVSGVGTIGSGAITSSGAVQGTSLTDGTATLTGGNLTGMGNYTSTGKVFLKNELGLGYATGYIGDGTATSKFNILAKINDGREAGYLAIGEVMLSGNRIKSGSYIDYDSLANITYYGGIDGSNVKHDGFSIARDTGLTTFISVKLPDHTIIGDATSNVKLSLRGTENGALSSKIYLTESAADSYGAYLHYDGSANVFKIGTLMTGEVPSITLARNTTEVNMLGKLRIGSATAPTHTLDVTGDSAFGDGTNDTRISSTGNMTFAGSAELIIPSSTTLPGTSNVGSMHLDTDAGTNGTVYIYANGAWRAMVVLP